MRKGGSEACFLTTSVHIKRWIHIYGAFSERAYMAGVQLVGGGWSRHMRNSNTGIWESYEFNSCLGAKRVAC